MKNIVKTFVNGTAPAFLIAGGATVAANAPAPLQGAASQPASQPSTGTATRPAWPNLPPNGGVIIINGVRN